MAQKLALPINNCIIQAMYQTDSNPAYQHEWDQAGHFGLDMTGAPNPFYASGNGKVVGVGGIANVGVGYWIAIQYDNIYKWNMNDDSLIEISSIIVRYFHLASIPALTTGTLVTLNTQIGTYSNTGVWQSTIGKHLHQKIKI